MEYTAIFERENFLQLPDALCKAWGIADDYDLYAAVQKGELLLTPKRTKNTVAVVGFFIGRGIALPPYLVKAAELQVGHEVSLTLESDVLRIKNTKIVSLHSPIVRRLLLDKKLQRELTAPQFWGETVLEDIYNIIALSDWDAEVTEKMLRMPNLLHDVACALHNEDVFSDFYENCVRHLILQCMSDVTMEDTKRKREQLGKKRVNPPLVCGYSR